LILDTCFFIDTDRGKPETLRFLAANPSERLCLAAITVGELACGMEPSEIAGLWSRLRSFQVLDVTPEAAVCYSQIYRRVCQTGRMIGTNDLWIAAIALANQMPVVTRNVEEFTRVPNLRVVGY